MKLTLTDVAREAGVSKMTVSRAINNDPWINSDTRQRVLEVVKRLNYKPHHFARALATNRSYLIGVIVPDLTHSYFAEILHGIESVGRKAGYELLCCISEENVNLELSKIRTLRKQTDGLIIATAGSAKKTALHREIVEAGDKVVLIDRTLEGTNCPAVTTDNVLVGRIAAEHLIKLGYERIGYLGMTGVSVGDDRLKGYKSALADNDLKFDESLINKCGLMKEDGCRAMKSWLKKGNVPDAVYAVNDPVAIGAMQAIADAGFIVGKDIGVVGSGNIYYGDMLAVPLTTVNWSRDIMGRAAAKLLIQLIEKKGVDGNQKIVLPPSLVVRQSCGQPEKSEAASPVFSLNRRNFTEK